ncbi:MAG: hypothetical protein HKN25_04220 [Pyrinomonadaceae bacterium]|nr:hypothetical protein [Pyrinomonadaceae bacterium]
MLNNLPVKFVLSALILAIGLLESTVFANGPENARLISGKSSSKPAKPPIIIIPGILGSELINEKTGEKVWFRISRSDEDDLRLPISLNLNESRDNLLPGDIIRTIDLRLLPDIKIYQEIIDSLRTRGGYEEASWDRPPRNIDGRFFVFPYDWRRDNVETARDLINKIDHLRAKSNTPRAKFDILAHSMGGLIARYAAMYGRTDLPKGKPRPTWIGEKYFNKVFLFGTPNEGSVEALETILEGRSSLGGVSNLPFVRDLTPLDIATMPSVLQLLPYENTVKVFNRDLEPIEINIYNIDVWRKYGWAVFNKEKQYLKDFSEAEAGRFEQYFSMALDRAKRFHEALRIPTRKKPSIQFHVVGSDCAETLDALIIYQKGKKWVTLTKPDSFRNSSGTKVPTEAVKKLIMVPGDGKVSRRSLLGESLSYGGSKNFGNSAILPITSKVIVCEEHDSLMGNSTILSRVFEKLAGNSKR